MVETKRRVRKVDSSAFPAWPYRSRRIENSQKDISKNNEKAMLLPGKKKNMPVGMDSLKTVLRHRPRRRWEGKTNY